MPNLILLVPHGTNTYMLSWSKRVAIGFLLLSLGCAQNPYERGGSPTGLSRHDVERDYMECEYKARLANEHHFYSRTSPFPFNPGPQSPADHARALHGLSTINAMRDTCLSAKGYRLN